MGRALIKFIRYIFTACLLFSASCTEAQVWIKGKILDASSKSPIAGATIKSVKDNSVTTSDNQGQFNLQLANDTDAISVGAMGYSSKRMKVDTAQSMMYIYLESNEYVLEEIHVNRTQKYKNRNPATDLIDLVIKNRSLNKLEKKDSLYFEQYEKLKMGIVNPKKFFEKAPREFNFFYQNVDTFSVKNKEVLTVLMKESMSDNYVKQHPARSKKIIKIEEKTEFDPRYINNSNIHSFMDYMFQPIDVYEESIYFINKQFLSPIASNAKLYYKYYVQDTLWNKNEFYVRLRFEPRNSTDVLFKGELLISMDGRYAVKFANMTLDDKANVSWVQDLKLSLSYFKDTSGVMLQDTSSVTVVFGRGEKDVMFGQRTSVNHNYDLHYVVPEHIFSGAPVEYKLQQSTSIDGLRPILLNKSERQTYSNVERLNNLKSFKALMSVGYLFSQGYYSLGKFELGPVEYIYHQNPIEGQRIRLGGRSTSAFSDKVYLEGYLAYGMRDEDLKYNLRTAVSLNGKSVTTFPAHYIEGFVQHDIFEPGKGLGFLKGDGFFRSFRSNKPTKYLSTHAYRLGHLIEFGNHVSLASNITLQRRNPIGNLGFEMTANPGEFLENINTSDVQLLLRWAPNEKFYYRNLQRNTIIENQPVFSLQYNKGLKGFLGGNYAYDALRASVGKRFFLNQLGFADVAVSAGQIWGTLPYPLLEMPNIQETRDRTTISYERINSMEFAADRFLKFSYDHKLNGFIMNKLPLVKKLKWRELWGARMFLGELSDHNNPYLSNMVVNFDKDEEGKVITRVMDNRPYWEGYVGLDNIFKILRVQYFVRMTYNEIKEPVKDRFRFSLHFSF